MAKRNGEDDKFDPKGNPGSDQTPPPAQGCNMPAYLSAALRIPSSYPLGAPGVDTNILGDIRKSGYPTQPHAYPYLKDTNPIPGVMSLKYIPTYGVSSGPKSALNRAIYSEFNAIRSKISGNRPYEPADHMIYRACVDSLRELYHYVRRIYGIVRVYSATNLYRPRAILKAMELDDESWISNAANLYQWLLDNQSALQPFPTVPIGKISDRHLLYNTALFTDGEPETAQTYIMNQATFYSYEVVDQVKGITSRAFPAKYSEFITMWDEMYTSLQNSSDVYIIAADIRRAFEDKATTDLPATDADYKVEYTKLDPILTSIMNATIVSCPKKSYDRFRVYDEDGCLKCQPEFSYFLPNSQTDRWEYYPMAAKFDHINLVSPNPSESDILSALRLRPNLQLVTFVSGGDLGDPESEKVGQKVTITDMGTEVIVGCEVIYDINGTAGANYGSAMLLDAYTISETRSVQSIMRSLAALSKFDWHPPVTVIVSQGTEGVEFEGTFEDVQNLVPVSDTNIKQVHDANLLAEFGF